MFNRRRSILSAPPRATQHHTAQHSTTQQWYAYELNSGSIKHNTAVVRSQT